MNGSTENTAHGAPKRSGRRQAVLNLATARNMLPLVQRVVSDILTCHDRLDRLIPQEERLRKERKLLDWPQRWRRYQAMEEIRQAESALADAQTELENLGVDLLDMSAGRVGFPTIVNSRKAFFSWRPGDEALHFWHFPEEVERRPIPATWARSANISLAK